MTNNSKIYVLHFDVVETAVKHASIQLITAVIRKLKINLKQISSTLLIIMNKAKLTLSLFLSLFSCFSDLLFYSQNRTLHKLCLTFV